MNSHMTHTLPKSARRPSADGYDVADLFNKQGMAPVANEPVEFGELIKADLERWMRVISDAGIERQ